MGQRKDNCVKNIYKYGPFYPDVVQEIPADPYYVGFQSGELYVWACHDDELEDGESLWEVIFIGTGWPIADDYIYIGTVQSKGGFVWHAFCKYKGIYV